MKRILSLTAVLALAACGGRNDGNVTDTMGATGAAQSGPAAAPAPMGDSLSVPDSAAVGVPMDSAGVSGTGASTGASAAAAGTGTGGTGSGSTGS